DGQTVECVRMRFDDGRRSACISTQAGCAMGCAFCATGVGGFGRNLSAGEILGQFLLIRAHERTRLSNVVFMGMGEPLANYDATVRAIRILAAPYGMGIGMRHITVSTVGLVPQIRRLAEERPGAGDGEERARGGDPGRVRPAPPGRRPRPSVALDPGSGHPMTPGRRILRLASHAAGKSDVGRVREINEDRMLLLDHAGRGMAVYAVADGLGGHAGGDVASTLAVETLARELPALLAEGGPARDALLETVRRANAAIYAAARGTERAGMATTCTAVLVNGGE